MYIYIYIYIYINDRWRATGRGASGEIGPVWEVFYVMMFVMGLQTPPTYGKQYNIIGKLKLSCDVIVVNHLSRQVIVFE